MGGYVWALLQGSQPADWLANLGVRSDQKLIMLDVVPSELQKILFEDLSGVARPRMVPMDRLRS